MAQKAPAVLIATPDSQWKIKITMPEGQGNFQGFIRFVHCTTGEAIANCTIGTGGDIEWTYSGPDNRTMQAVLPHNATKNLGKGEWGADLVRGSVGSPGTRRAAIVVKQVWQGEVGGMGEMVLTGDGECEIQIVEQTANYPFDLLALIAQMQAYVASAQGNALLTQTLSDSVSALALVMGGYKTAAEIAAQTAIALSGLAGLSAAARAILLDTNTLAAYVYDTSRDDNPEWPRQVTNSLTNMPLGTANRGSKAQHPRLTLITATVGTGRKFTIYDADDPSCPMWVTWNEGANNLFQTTVVPQVTAISARNGAITIGTATAGMISIDLLADEAWWFRNGVTPNSGKYLGSLADGDSAKGFTGQLSSWFGGPPVAFVNGIVNHLAMTVLEHTRPNPNRLGMRNPTVACATAGGTAVFNAEGGITNSSYTTAMGRVSFDKDGNLYATASTANSTIWIHDYPGYMVASFGYTVLTSGTNPSTMMGSASGPVVVRSAGDRIAVGAPGAGVAILSRHKGLLGASAVAAFDEWRGTGYQFGVSRMACAESLRLLAPLQSTELLTNGSFATDLSGWGNINSGTGFTPPTWDAGNGGRVALQRVDGTNLGRINQTITTVVGQTYAIRTTTSGIACAVWVGTSVGTGNVLQNIASVGTSTVMFRATTTSVVIMLFSSTNGTTGYVDDISIKAVIADHSPAANHLSIVGTLNRSVVAAGAELAAINGFSTSNYAEAPYSASLDPGSGEFSVGCMVVTTGGATKRVALLDRSAVSQTGAYYRLFLNGSGWPSFIISDGTNIAAANASSPLTPGAHRIRGIRRASPARIELEVDGQIVGTTALTTMGSLNNASAVLRLGLFTDGTSPMDVAGPGLTLFGMSATAPSIEQMRAAWADEVQMFQPNAKCLLQGSSGVQDIAYDPDTGLIYVAKSAGGTDVFQGLINRGTILSTASANLIPGAGFVDVFALTGAASKGATISGAPNWGRGRLTGVVEDGTTGGHYVYGAGVAFPASSHVFGVPLRKGSRTWVRPNIESLAMFVNLDTGATGSVTAGVTALPSVDLGDGVWLVQFVFTGTGASLRPILYGASSNSSVSYAGNNGVGGPAFYHGDPIVRAGSTPFTAADFQSAMSRSDNHKFVSAHDGNIFIATATGADVVMPALSLRERLRSRRPPSVIDPNFSRFDGRVTADGTPIFNGNPFFVPEGQKVDFTINVGAHMTGGAATEYASYTINGHARRKIGDAAATVVIRGNPPTQDETTAAMDATVVSMGGGWVTPQISGKLATRLEWSGDQSIRRSLAG